METEIIEMGKISSRGQIAIPSEIRQELGLKDGTKVLFVLEKDILFIKKVSKKTFSAITKPFKEAAKKAGIKESDVPKIMHKIRKR